MTSSARDIWTYSEYARLPDDGNRYEVIDGEVLVTPAPGTLHQHVAANLFLEIREYVRQGDLGVVLWDVDLLFIDGQFLRPDFLYVPKSLRAGITDRGVEVAPDLVVEVLTPSSRAIDLVKKPRRYGEFGVREYWVADPAERVVHRFAGTSECVEGQLQWQPEPHLSAARIDLASVFAAF